MIPGEGRLRSSSVVHFGLTNSEESLCFCNESLPHLGALLTGVTDWWLSKSGILLDLVRVSLFSLSLLFFTARPLEEVSLKWVTVSLSGVFIPFGGGSGANRFFRADIFLPGKEMLTLEVARVDCQKYSLMILKRIEAREYLKPHQLTATRRVDILFTSFTPPYQTDKRMKWK